jgi:PEP-CTERM motif
MSRIQIFRLFLIAILGGVAAPSHATLFSVAGPPAFNVDTDPATSVYLTGPIGLGYVTSLTLTVTIGEPYADDVSIFLVHGSTTVQVYNGIGDTSDSVIDATFDDLAIDDYPANGSAIGTFRPSPDSLSAFIGHDLDGTWELRILDPIVPGDGTPLLSWSINGDAVAVPEPSTLALFGAGSGLLASLAAWRRRRRTTRRC